MVRKKGTTWEARAYWRDASGNKQSKYHAGFKTKAAAEKWERDTIAANKHTTRADAHQVTVNQLYYEWLEKLRDRGRSPSTIASYEYDATHFLPLIGCMSVQEVRRWHVQDVIDKIAVKPNLSPETVRKAARGLRSLFSYGVENGVIDISPFIKINLPESHPKPLRKYTPVQVNELISGLRRQFHIIYVIIVFCLLYGLRRGEACGIRWCDIDWDSGIVTVRGSISMAKTDIYYGPTKTRQSSDTIVLTPWFLEDLRQIRRERFANGTLHIPNITAVTTHVPINDVNPYQFVSLDANNNVMRPDGIPGRLRRFQKANNLPITSIKDLRKNYGTLLKESGADIATISKALRHSSIKITSDQYIDSTAEIKRQATTTMDHLIKIEPGN